MTIYHVGFRVARYARAVTRVVRQYPSSPIRYLEIKKKRITPKNNMTVVTNRFEPWGLHLLFNQPPIDFLFSSWLIKPFDLLQVRCSHTLIKELFLAKLLSAELTNRNWIWNNLVRIASLKILIILKQVLQHQDVVNDRNCSAANKTVDNLN